MDSYQNGQGAAASDGAVWDWGDDGFVRDQESEWKGIGPADTWEGVGRLIHETQLLAESLIVSQARWMGLFRDGRAQYTREQLESNFDVQQLRRSTLGALIRKLDGDADFEYEKDLRTLKRILDDRNYFVHRFYYETMREGYGIEELNRDVRRLKIAINTAAKFNSRYAGLVEEALRDRSP